MAGKLVLLKSFNCPSCGAPQQIRAGGFANTLVCTSCGATIDLSADEFTVLRKGSQDDSHFQGYQYLPFGARGDFSDGQFEVIGFMVRCDNTGVYLWREYLLFNPYKGFRWLVEMNGHWNFVRMIKTRPGTPGDSAVRMEGLTFSLFLRDRARVKYVLGEFYWEVLVGDTVRTCDYINPPYGLSCEISDDEVVWSTLEYMEPSVIAQAFKLDHRLPSPSGVSPTQPTPGGNITGVLFSAALSLIAVIFLQCYFVTVAKRKVVVPTMEFAFRPEDPDKIKRTEIFEIPKTGNIEIATNAPVDNNWIDLGIDLVNADTQETEERSLEVSYYHGVEDGESWTEGSQSNSDVVGAIPPGRYYFAIEPSTDPGVTYMPYTFQARYDVPTAGNFFAAILVLGAYPVFAWIRRSSFETLRWSDSSET